jgi:hypothetical protein
MKNTDKPENWSCWEFACCGRPLKEPLDRTGGRGKGGCGVIKCGAGGSVGGVLVRKPQELAGKRLSREISRRFSFAESVAFRTALPRFLLAAVFRRVCPDLQVDSRTRMRPSSKWISGAFHVWLWSIPSRSGLDGFRGRLNLSRSGSSSGIHSLIATGSS